MRGRSLPAVDNVNADRDQDHCDDILDFEFLVKQKSGEDDAQDRDQGIVDGNLADGVAGQQRVVDGEAYCGDGNQAEKDEAAHGIEDGGPGAAVVAKADVRKQSHISKKLKLNILRKYRKTIGRV